MKSPQIFSPWQGLTFLAVMGAALLANRSLSVRAQDQTVLFQDDFSAYPAGLLTNEYAFENPTDPKACLTPKWEVTSGSLFISEGAGYTGVPDRAAPNFASVKANDSAVFRCRTSATNFGDVRFSLSIWNEAFVSPTKSPAKSYDGIHLWLRYISDESLYSVTVNRRDNIAVIKKKVPGGPSNGGTYYTLKSVPYSFTPKTWQHFTASAKNTPEGAVLISLFCDDKPVVSALDDGTKGGPPIAAPGRVGVRGDNCQFKFDDVVVHPAL